MAKDLFSVQSDAYAKYRPTYPQQLFDYILQFVPDKNAAWDCATGNGQCAAVLAQYFQKVEATDISEQQLKNATQKSNIHYQVSPAEKTPFADHQFDLVTIATAYHWLHWDAFYKEACRLGKPGCVVAAWSYHLLQCADEKIDAVIKHFYKDITGPYWDAERKYVDDAYTTVQFDFEPLPLKDFAIEVQWSKDELKGYLGTWSAVQHYIKEKAIDPVSLIAAELDAHWPEGTRNFRFPLFMKLGRVPK